MTEAKYVRNKIGAARAYVFGRLDLPEFVKRAFGAEELERNGPGAWFHIDMKIGDSVIVLEVHESPRPEARPCSLYVYVEDVDATYERAVLAGATPRRAPADQPYQERNAELRDSFGNTWYVSTYKGNS